MRIGFVGLGDQGGAMAERLIDHGHAVTIWARRQEVRQRFGALGASVAEDAAGAAADCELLALCVGNEADVRQLLFAEGMLDALKPGTIVAIHSTIAPESCHALSADCASRDIGFLDVPVSGSGRAARSGLLLVLAGGDGNVLLRARPVLSAFAGKILHMGGVGAGMHAKLINNLLSAAQIGLAQVALDLGATLQLDLPVLREGVLAGTGRSYGMEALIRLQRPERAAHIATILEKDVALARHSTWGANGDAKALLCAAEMGVERLRALAKGEGGLLPPDMLEVIAAL